MAAKPSFKERLGAFFNDPINEFDTSAFGAQLGEMGGYKAAGHAKGRISRPVARLGDTSSILSQGAVGGSAWGASANDPFATLKMALEDPSVRAGLKEIFSGDDDEPVTNVGTHDVPGSAGTIGVGGTPTPEVQGQDLPEEIDPEVLRQIEEEVRGKMMGSLLGDRR